MDYISSGIPQSWPLWPALRPPRLNCRKLRTTCIRTTQVNVFEWGVNFGRKSPCNSKPVTLKGLDLVIFALAKPRRFRIKKRERLMRIWDANVYFSLQISKPSFLWAYVHVGPSQVQNDRRNRIGVWFFLKSIKHKTTMLPNLFLSKNSKLFSEFNKHFHFFAHLWRQERKMLLFTDVKRLDI